MYCKGRNGRNGGKGPERLEEIFVSLPKNENVALQTRLGAMRHKVSHLCIFSYDGTDRIRFAGQDYRV